MQMFYGLAHLEGAVGTTWLSQTGGARLLPDSEGPLQELDPQDPVTQCTAGAGPDQPPVP